MILFAAFGLLSLSLGEKRIQKRMLRQQMKTALPYPQPSTAVTVDSAARIESRPEQPVSGSSDLEKQTTPNLPAYRLGGLRWILSITIVTGIAVLYWENKSRLNKGQRAAIH